MKTLVQVIEETRLEQELLLQKVRAAVNDYTLALWVRIAEVDQAEMPDGLLEVHRLIFRQQVSDNTVGGREWPLEFSFLVGRIATFPDSDEEERSWKEGS